MIPKLPHKTSVGVTRYASSKANLLMQEFAPSLHTGEAVVRGEMSAGHPGVLTTERPLLRPGPVAPSEIVGPPERDGECVDQIAVATTSEVKTAAHRLGVVGQ